MNKILGEPRRSKSVKLQVRRHTCVKDFKMKYRFGKCFCRKLDVVEAYDPELLEWCGGERPGDACRLEESSLENVAVCGDGSPESEGVAGGSSSLSSFSFPLSFSFSFCPFIHLVCMPMPRWPPTPARRSSSFPRTRHTSFGHRGSPGRIC